MLEPAGSGIGDFMPTIRKKPKMRRSPKNSLRKVARPQISAFLHGPPLTADKCEDPRAGFEIAYLSDSNEDFWNELRLALGQLSNEAERAGTPLALVLTRHSDSGWEVEDRPDPFDVPRILKAKGLASKGAMHSISRIVPITTHAPEDSQADFLLAAEIITLRWGAGDTPAYSPHSIWHVGDGGPRATIEAFFDAPRLLADEARQAAKAAGNRKWRDARSERKRVILQVRSQMPVTKSVFGVGAGEELRRIALVKPQQRVKFAKRDPNAVSREDMIDGFWDEAFRLGLPRPQRVKI